MVQPTENFRSRFKHLPRPRHSPSPDQSNPGGLRYGFPDPAHSHKPRDSLSASSESQSSGSNQHRVPVQRRPLPSLPPQRRTASPEHSTSRVLDLRQLGHEFESLSFSQHSEEEMNARLPFRGPPRRGTAPGIALDMDRPRSGSSTTSEEGIFSWEQKLWENHNEQLSASCTIPKQSHSDSYSTCTLHKYNLPRESSGSSARSRIVLPSWCQTCCRPPGAYINGQYCHECKRGGAHETDEKTPTQTPRQSPLHSPRRPAPRPPLPAQSEISKNKSHSHSGSRIQKARPLVVVPDDVLEDSLLMSALRSGQIDVDWRRKSDLESHERRSSRVVRRNAKQSPAAHVPKKLEIPKIWSNRLSRLAKSTAWIRAQRSQGAGSVDRELEVEDNATSRNSRVQNTVSGIHSPARDGIWRTVEEAVLRAHDTGEAEQEEGLVARPGPAGGFAAYCSPQTATTLLGMRYMVQAARRTGTYPREMYLPEVQHLE